MKNPCYFCDFCDICGHFRALLGFFCFQVFILVRFLIFAILQYFSRVFLASKKKSLLLLRFLRYLRTFLGRSWLLLFPSLDSFYICYFCHFCDICHGCFQLARKILVTFAIFADISGSFLVSFFSKYWFLLDLLFLRFLWYL